MSTPTAAGAGSCGLSLTTLVDAGVVECAAAVAVEDLAHRRHGNLNIPAVAFMLLAPSGARRLVVRMRRAFGVDMDSVDAAIRFLQLAPVNVGRLVIDRTVVMADWQRVVAALAANPCHSYVRRLLLPTELRIGAADATAVLAATSGFAHLRSLQCAGAGADTLLDVVDGTLHRLALVDCKEMQRIEFARMPLLRRVGPLCALPAAITALDLSGLPHLTRLGDEFGGECHGLRNVRLPPSVTAIGRLFLINCLNFATALDLSHLTRLHSVGPFFARGSSLCDVRLPPSVTSIGEFFLHCCPSFTAVLDLSHLTLLPSISSGFAKSSSIPGLRLPSSVKSIGYNFLDQCTSFTGVLDLSHLTQLQRVDVRFAASSSISGVRLPHSVTSISDCFMCECRSLTSVLDLSHLAQLASVGDYFAGDSCAAGVKLPSSVTTIGSRFLHRCATLAGVLDVSHLTQLRSIGARFAAQSAVLDVRLPARTVGVVHVGRAFLADCPNIAEERRRVLFRAVCRLGE
jgi:hypothetical protein